jgi:hypothetical protein
MKTSMIHQNNRCFSIINPTKRYHITRLRKIFIGVNIKRQRTLNLVNMYHNGVGLASNMKMASLTLTITSPCTQQCQHVNMIQILLYDNAINISNSIFLFPHDSPIKSNNLLEIAPHAKTKWCGQALITMILFVG